MISWYVSARHMLFAVGHMFQLTCPEAGLRAAGGFFDEQIDVIWLELWLIERSSKPWTTLSFLVELTRLSSSFSQHYSKDAGEYADDDELVAENDWLNATNTLATAFYHMVRKHFEL